MEGRIERTGVGPPGSCVIEPLAPSSPDKRAYTGRMWQSTGKSRSRRRTTRCAGIDLSGPMAGSEFIRPVERLASARAWSGRRSWVLPHQAASASYPLDLAANLAVPIRLPRRCHASLGRPRGTRARSAARGTYEAAQRAESKRGHIDLESPSRPQQSKLSSPPRVQHGVYVPLRCRFLWGRHATERSAIAVSITLPATRTRGRGRNT